MNKRKRIVPNVIRGGVAIPLGANYFLMDGRTHEQGGIDIGKDLEVENGEIIKMNPKSIKVLSNAPIIDGISPAQMALGGLQDGTFVDRYNSGFKYQEKYKDINGLKDDGTEAFLGIFKKKDNKDDDSTKTDGKGFLKALRDRTQHLFNNSIVGTSLKRMRENDSPTKAETEKIEDDIAYRHERFLKSAKQKGIESNKYYIPYIPEKEIIVKGAGRASSNMLDSIAVNSVKAKIPFKEGLGLAVEETKMGAIPNISTDAWIDSFEKTNNRKPTSEEIANYERIVLNSSFARNYGGIHPQFLINDHEWWQRGWEESPKYANLLGDIESPLQHGFTLYKLGLYNTGDKYHKSKVISAGNKAMASKDVQEWLKTSKYAKNIIKKLGGEMKINKIKRNASSTGERKKAELGKVTPIIGRAIVQNPNTKLAVRQPHIVEPEVGFFQANPNFLSGAISAAGNLIGAGISYGINKKMLKDLKAPSAPAILQPVSYKTRININPQIREIKNTLNKYRKAIDQNTVSSQVGLSRLRGAYTDSLEQLTDIYGQKENAETQLVNQNIAQQQETAKYNLENYNNWIDKVNNFENTRRELRSENANAFIQSGIGAFSDFLNKNAQWRTSMANISALAAAYPDVTADLMAEKGLPYAKWLEQQKGKKDVKWYNFV